MPCGISLGMSGTIHFTDIKNDIGTTINGNNNQLSAQKRKRDDGGNKAYSPSSTSPRWGRRGGAIQTLRGNSRELHRLPTVGGPQNTTSRRMARLFSCGDLVVLGEDDQISLNMGIIDSKEPVSVIIPADGCHLSDLERQLCVSFASSGARDMIGCSPHGDLVLSTTEVDGTGTSFYQSVPLRNDRERVLCLLQSGECSVIGTSTGDIVVIRKENSELLTDRLHRPPNAAAPTVGGPGNLFLGLLNTGAKLLGLGTPEAAGPGGEITHLLDVPRATRTTARSAALSHGNDNTCSFNDAPALMVWSHGGAQLWARWQDPGAEELLWEEPRLLERLSADVKRQALGLGVDERPFTVEDVLAMPSDEGMGCVAVLSSIGREGAVDISARMQGETEGEIEPGTAFLWLHLLKFPLTTTSKARPQQSSPVVIHGRMRIASDVLLQPRPDSATAFRPRLYRAPPVDIAVMDYNGSGSSSSSSSNNNNNNNNNLVNNRYLGGAAVKRSNDSWRIYLSWLASAPAPSSPQRSGPSAYFSSSSSLSSQESINSMVKIAHIDLQEIPDLSDPQQRTLDESDLYALGDVADSGMATLRSGTGSSIPMDTGTVSGENVLCAGAVDGLDGVCLLLRDGALLLCTPPLSDRKLPGGAVVRSPAPAPQSPQTRRQQTFEFTFHPTSESAHPNRASAMTDLTRYLETVAAGETTVFSSTDVASLGPGQQEPGQESALVRLRRILASITREDFAEVVAVVSRQIATRSSAGQHWGSGVGARLAEPPATASSSSSSVRISGVDSRATYQLAHRLASDKADAHSRLVGVLLQTGLLVGGLPPTVRVMVLRSQQQLLGAVGLCQAVQEVLQRVAATAAEAPKSPMVTAIAAGAMGIADGGVFNSSDDSSMPMDAKYTGPEASVDRAATRAAASVGACASDFGPLGDRSIRNTRFLHVACREGLQVIARGVEKAVTQAYPNQGTGAGPTSARELSLRGLSTADVFFADAERMPWGFACVASALGEMKADLAGRGVLLPATYAVANCLLASLQTAASAYAPTRQDHGERKSDEGSTGRPSANAFDRSGFGYGAGHASTALVCDPSVRAALLEVLTHLRLACEAVKDAAVREGRLLLIAQRHGTTPGTGTVRVPTGAGLETLFEDLGLLQSQEGRRVKALCTAILKGYTLLAAGLLNPTGEPSDVTEDLVTSVVEGRAMASLPARFADEFVTAKSRCVAALLRLGHASAAFDLSVQFLHFSGLLEALDLVEEGSTSSPPSSSSWSVSSLPASSAGLMGSGVPSHKMLQTADAMRMRFRELVREKAGVVGVQAGGAGSRSSAPEPLASFCLRWLEEKGRPVALLELGKLAPTHLAAFLEHRPQLAWIHHIGHRSFGPAAASAAAHGAFEPRAATAGTLFSLAKLGAHLDAVCALDHRDSQLTRESSSSSSATLSAVDVNGTSTVQALNTLPPEHAASLKKRFTRLPLNLHRAARVADEELAWLRGQQLLLEGDTSLIADRSGDISAYAVRLPPADLINKLIAMAQGRSAGLSMTGGMEMLLGGAAGQAAEEDVLKYLNMCLGLLSLRKDKLSAAAKAVGDAVEGRDREEQDRDQGLTEEQLVNVWAMAISTQQQTFVNIALRSLTSLVAVGGEVNVGEAVLLGQEEEDSMKSTVLARLAEDCRQSVLIGALRGDLYPATVPMDVNSLSSTDRQGHGNRGGLELGGVDLDEVILRSGVLTCAALTEVATSLANQPQPMGVSRRVAGHTPVGIYQEMLKHRIAYIVRVCVSPAF